MSYDFFLFEWKNDGEYSPDVYTPETYAALLLDGIIDSDSIPITPEQVKRNENIVAALREYNNEFIVDPIGFSAPFGKDRAILRIMLNNDYASVALPDWWDEPVPHDFLTAASECIKIIHQHSGYYVYDEQTSKILSSDNGFHISAASIEANIAKRKEWAKRQEQKEATNPRWKFWQTQ